ncbi:MAG: hypothetical protein KJZ65_10820 [Phycisphaerales bacterium]|nr:hypothetical protein [Phycisphaerales bacterium]
MSVERTGPARLLSTLEPFVVAPWWRFGSLNLRPFGVAVRPDNCFDVLSSRAERLLHRLVRLDRLTFGPEGMPMPRWLFVDGSALPGVISGLGIRADELPPRAVQRLGLEARPSDLVPLAMYIAVPARPPLVWYGHNLASLNRQLPEMELGGLATLTKALGLSIMRCTTQIGATQWTSAALHVHARFGPMELLTAWTPAHANPATLTYKLELDESLLERVAQGIRPGMVTEDPFWIEPRDHDAIRALEERIERGKRFAVVGPPDRKGRVPVAPVSPHQAA